MHACMKWVCSFKALVRVSEMGLGSMTYLGCWYVIHVCWFKSLEYHWRINIVFVQTTAGREVLAGVNLKSIALLLRECDG